MSRQGQGGASSTTPDFLWVNRTPESDTLCATREERDELRTITSHARQRRATLRLQKRIYSAQTGAAHAQSIVGWGARGTYSETIRRYLSSTITHRYYPDHGLQYRSFTYLESPDDARWPHCAFQYAVNSWLPSVFQDLDGLDAVLPISDSSRTTIDPVIQGCPQKEMHMFSLLAASSSFMKCILKLQLERHDTPGYGMGKLFDIYGIIWPRAIHTWTKVWCSNL